MQNTPDVFYSAMYNDVDAIKDYLKLFDMHLLDSNGQTLLHYAANNNGVDVAHLLIDAGINPDIADHQGETALFLAATKGNLTVAKIILRRHVKMDAQNKRGETVLHKAARKGNIDVVKLLLEQGAYLRLATHIGETPIHYAVKSGYPKLVFMLLQIAKQDVNHTDARGNTLLHHAAKADTMHVVEMLLQENAKPYLKNTLSETPLHIAAEYAKTDVLEALCQAGAILETRTKNGESIADAAIRGNKLDNLAWLETTALKSQYRDRQEKFKLHHAVLLGDIRSVQSYLLQGIPQTPDTFGKTPLQYAKDLGNPEILSILKKN